MIFTPNPPFKRARVTAIAAFCGLAMPSSATEPPAAFTRTYHHSGGEVQVDFTLCPVRGPSFEVYQHTGGAGYQSFSPTRPARTYLGRVRELPGAIAAGQLLDDGSVRTAILFEDGTTWHGTGTSLTIPSPASWTPKYPTSLIGSGGAGGDIHAADVGLDLTYTYFNQAGLDPSEALERAEWAVIETNAIYLRDAAIFERIGRVVIRTDANDDRSTSLSLMKSEWESVLPADLPGSNHDLAATVVVTGSSGLAYVASVGTSNRYSWNSISGSSSDGSFCTVWRHEGGHNWGAGHSEGGAPEGPTIMSGNGLSRFSSSDLAVMVSHRNSRPEGLLDHLGPWTTPLPPRANADRGRALLNGSPLLLDVLDNDSDSNGDSFTLHSFDTTTERGGTVTRVSAATPGGRDKLSYTPDSGFTDGIDWFTYRIEDVTGMQGVAYVMIQPPPQEPDFDVVADVTSISDGEWTAATTWDNGSAAAAGHDYEVRAGDTVDTPASGNLTFPGDSLQVGGTFRLRHTSGGGNTTQTLDLKPMVLKAGSVLQSYNTSLGNVYRVLNSAMAVPEGIVTIRIRSDSGSAYTNSLSLNGGLFGSGDIALTGSLQGQSGERRRLSLDVPECRFSGNWTVAGDGGDDSRRLFLIANAARALGTGSVTLGNRSQLRNAAAQGLDSLAGVVLTSSTSTLQLVTPWINPQASLVVQAGTLDIGSGHSRVGDLQIGGFSLSPGTYTTDDLTSIVPDATITGSGTLSVGPFPPDAISIADGSSADAATWSHALPAPVAGTQGEGLSYLIKDHVVTSSDPSANQQAIIGTSLRIGGGGTLDLARLHSATNQNVTYNLPALGLEDGGTIRFRASTGSDTHLLGAALAVAGDVVLRVNGGSYSNNASLSGEISGSGNIDIISDTNASGSSQNIRRVSVLSADNPFVGAWTVRHTASGDDYAALSADAARALGTGSVTIDTRARLINAFPQGLDSLASVVLSASTSKLSLDSPWTNPSAELTVNAGSIDLGAGHSLIGLLEVSGNPVSPGIYDADDLPEGKFAGSGTLTVTGPQTVYQSSYSEWMASHGSIGTPEAREYTADPDHDGQPNLIEYLLDSDPSSGSAPHLPAVSAAGGFLVFTFTRIKTADFDTTVEFAVDPRFSWTEADAGMITIEDLGDREKVTAKLPASSGPGHLFARLRVNRN